MPDLMTKAGKKTWIHAENAEKNGNSESLRIFMAQRLHHLPRIPFNLSRNNRVFRCVL